MATETYGRLTVLSIHSRVNGKPRVLCRCTCGNEVVRYRADVRGGKTVSCGCASKEGQEVVKALRASFPARKKIEKPSEATLVANTLSEALAANRCALPSSLQQLTGRIISMRHNTGRSFSHSHLPQHHSSAFTTMGEA